MNLSLSPVSRRALVVGGWLVLALALLTGARSASLAGSLGWYNDANEPRVCDEVDKANPGLPNPNAGAVDPCWDADESRLDGGGGLASCADNQDNDSDERTDCADPDCFGKDGCGTGEWCNVESAEFAGQGGDCGGDAGVNRCDDGLDNDSDGLYDCADPDCMYGSGTQSTICVSVDPTCAEYTCNAGSIGQDEAQCGGDCSAERCGDGQDNDGDGFSDCADPSCSRSSTCAAVCDASAENDSTSCSDGQDNDKDGSVDCDDADCDYDNSATCWWASTGINPANWFSDHEAACSDGADNDSDGFYDCADVSDCSSDQACSSYCGGGNGGAETSPWGYFDWGYCGNGADDDGDGRVDCRDADCAGAPACSARPCEATEQDSDGNCEADNTYWGSSCADGFDNDGNGLADCQDPSCAADDACRTVQTLPRSEIAPDGVPVNWIYGNGFCVDGYNNDPYDSTNGTGNSATDCWDSVCQGQDPVCYSQNLGGQGWPYGGAGEGYCGDGVCRADEDVAYCPQDCGGGAGGSCPNGACDNGESRESCPQDCQAGIGFCGDQVCGSGETCESCSQDCGSCPNGGYCGDGVCQAGESCAADCGGGTGDCGNGTCDWNEDCSSCTADCGTCGGGFPEICDDGQDNDGDGSSDCGDSDCTAHSSCGVGLYEICGNGYDDDADTFVDCADSECEYDRSCVTPENCYSATKSAIDIATEVGWDENGTTSVSSWNRTPSGGWDEKVTSFLQSQAQGAIRSAILNSLAGDGHALISVGGCFPF